MTSTILLVRWLVSVKKMYSLEIMHSRDRSRICQSKGRLTVHCVSTCAAGEKLSPPRRYNSMHGRHIEKTLSLQNIPIVQSIVQKLYMRPRKFKSLWANLPARLENVRKCAFQEGMGGSSLITLLYKSPSVNLAFYSCSVATLIMKRRYAHLASISLSSSRNISLRPSRNRSDLAGLLSGFDLASSISNF